jgi:hypothetical protein
MSIVCEHMLYEEHRGAEAGPFTPCGRCRKFPDNGGQGCYHCYSVGNTIVECPECEGKPWSAEFLAARREMETAGEPDESAPEPTGDPVQFIKTLRSLSPAPRRATPKRPS